MTSIFEGQFQGVPGITINPPITMATKDTVTSQTVADCFATDADSVYDALTDEIWIRQNGTFVKADY